MARSCRIIFVTGHGDVPMAVVVVVVVVVVAVVVVAMWVVVAAAMHGCLVDGSLYSRRELA